MEECISNKRNSIFVLYGQKGMGKKSSVRWAVRFFNNSGATAAIYNSN
jgi:hypothetical protein